jgi:DNA-binding MarR family transcriptional regulator
MNGLSSDLRFILRFLKTQSVMMRRFDSYLDGLGLNEFVILYQLSVCRDHRLRRVDLAERLGLTASGVTRLLNPMEKIGLVGREVNERDARSTYVTLSSGGRRKLEEALLQAELFCEDHFSGVSRKGIKSFLKSL